MNGYTTTCVSNLLNFGDKMLFSDFFFMECTMPLGKLLQIMGKNKSKETEFEFHFVIETLLIVIGIRLMR